MSDGSYNQFIPQTNIYMIKNDSEDIIISKNNMNEIREVSIHSKSSEKRSIDLVQVEPGSDVYVGINEDDIDYDSINEEYRFDDNIDEEENQETKFNFNIDSSWEAQECNDVYNLIEIAIAYDSTYCDHFDGDVEKANDSIFELVAHVSHMYQQKGLCTVLQISHLESNCDILSDPYREMLSSQIGTCSSWGSVLDVFESYWQENRQDVHRDVAHLVTGTPLGCNDDGACVLGCANFATLCDEYSGYGVNHLTFSSNTKMKRQTFAHELGHNARALHTLDEGAIMNPSFGNKDVTFSSTTIQNILSYYNSSEAECIERIAYTPPPPTPSPTMSNNCFGCSNELPQVLSHMLSWFSSPASR